MFPTPSAPEISAENQRLPRRTLWKVGEGTVRRWRKQVESLIDEGCPESSETEWNVSPERIDTTEGSVIAAPYRENEEGDTVAVRQEPKETTPEERAEFWFTIRKSGLFDQRSDGSRFLDRNGFQLEPLYGLYLRAVQRQSGRYPAPVIHDATQENP